MGEAKQVIIGTFVIRQKENWFKELLIKLKIIKPKYIEFGTSEINYKDGDTNEM